MLDHTHITSNVTLWPRIPNGSSISLELLTLRHDFVGLQLCMPHLRVPKTLVLEYADPSVSVLLYLKLSNKAKLASRDQVGC